MYVCLVLVVVLIATCAGWQLALNIAWSSRCVMLRCLDFSLFMSFAYSSITRSAGTSEGQGGQLFQRALSIL